ncbi:TRAP transporter substrate-binding protein DctP [Hoeflea sp. BAL378]|uniref:TRAP transporter substrate-binding protein DctP n=1 Tax=Hoeflea sp. BAL378 TaxID=1547437 RepID=UPI001AEC5084|nr:TRAP transporter substrate-binding protein DctP [Hoeflea sp. BAL378]
MMKNIKPSMLRGRLLAGVFGMALCLSAGPATAQDVRWTMATYSGGHWLDYGVTNFVRLVDEMTDGRVKIDISQPGTMGSALKVTETVQNGITQVGHNWPGYDWGVDTAGAPFGGWAGGLTPEEQLLWMYKAGGAEMLAEWRLEKFDVVSFPCAVAETEVFLHSHKPVRTLEDFKGLKIRTAGAWADIAAGLGASTVVLGGSEVFSALERHVVDAVEWGGPALNVSTGFRTISKYIVVPGIHQPSSLQECMFNKDAWAQLSPHDQNQIKLAAELNAFDTFLQYGDEDVDGWNTLTEGDNEIVTLDPEFIEAARKASYEWADGKAAENPWFKRVYDSQRAFQKRYSRWSEFRIPIGAASVE